MKTCYKCDEPLIDADKDNMIDGNITKEHIILNSIGGRLKSKDLLCKKCNSELGHSADAVLANQLAPIATLLAIKRQDRQPNQVIDGAVSKSGREFSIGERGKPIPAKTNFKEEVNGKETHYELSARNTKELNRMLKTIKKKHPNFNVENARKNYIHHTEYLNEIISVPMEIGGLVAFQSIAKTAINYYVLQSGESSYIKHLLPYMQDPEAAKVVHHYRDEALYQMEPNEVCHIIHLVGNPEKQLLYCYVEFFSAYSFIILLSDKYQGDAILSTYCYDVLLVKEIDKNIVLNLTLEQIKDAINNPKNYGTEIAARLTRINKISGQISVNHERERITKDVVDRLFKKYENEPVFTEAMKDELLEELAINHVAFLNRISESKPLNK